MRKIPKEIENLNRDELESMIEKWVILRRNSERNRSILKRSWFDGIGYERIAEEYNLSVTQVKEIIYKSEEQIFKHL